LTLATPAATTVTPAVLKNFICDNSCAPAATTTVTPRSPTTVTPQSFERGLLPSIYGAHLAGDAG